MQLKRTPIPAAHTGNKVSTWNTHITPSMRSEMSRNPGVAYQLVGDDGLPLMLPKNVVSSLLASCPRPFRVQSRATGESKKFRLVWVSMDPGHWERVAKTHRKNTPA